VNHWVPKQGSDTVSASMMASHRPRSLSGGLASSGTAPAIFDKCYVESGALALARPNGLELCPDALLMESAVAVVRRFRRAGR
jgi:hypothetical protein